MGTTSHQAAIGVLAGLAFACFGQIASAQDSPASGWGRHGSRIRTDSAIVGAVVHDALERSETLRALVAAIEATDGLVYLNVGTCGRLRACLLHRVTLAGPSRVLHLVVNVRRHDLTLAAPIAHELQHALEVLGDARIRSDAALFAFYKIHGLKVKGVLETRAAIAAGDAVRQEVKRYPSARLSNSSN
jgi:hypothetical protein